MKKFIFMVGAMLVLSAAATVAYKAYTRAQMSDFMKANLEALTQNEAAGSLSGTCYKTPGYTCMYICPCCNAKWYRNDPGPVKHISGQCSCGNMINAYY